MSERKTHRLVQDFDSSGRKRIICMSCMSRSGTSHTLTQWFTTNKERWELQLIEFYLAHPSGTEIAVEGTWKKDQY